MQCFPQIEYLLVAVGGAVCARCPRRDSHSLEGDSNLGYFLQLQFIGDVP